MKNRFKKLIKKIKDDDRGSAIILALIIIAALATTGIGAARLTKSNIAQTTSFEDGLKAYYAAEAGVEAALLEWRFDHDVEFWNADKARACYNAVKSSPDTLDNPSCELAKMTRIVNLQGGVDEDPVDITSQKFNIENGDISNDKFTGPTNQPWYELKIYYRDPKRPFIGDPNDPTNITDTSVKLAKDQSYEMRFAEGDQVGSVMLYWNVPFSYSSPSEEVRLMWHPIGLKGEVEELMDDPTVSDQQRKYYSDDLALARPKSFLLPSSGVYSEIKNIRIKGIIKTENDYTNSGELKSVILSSEAFDKNNNIIHIPSGEVNIEVVGHYNNTERKLTYTLSRESGTIMDIFDFGVFSQSSLRK